MSKRIHSMLAVLVILLTACQPHQEAPSSDGLMVLASNTILADIAQHVAGDILTVASLLPAGADPHEYQATPADVQKVSRSSVLIINGLDYERFIDPLLENAGGKRLTVAASSGLEPRSLEDQTGEAAPDPHMWLDPVHVITYVENIRAGLSQADPDHAAAYQQNASSYISELRALDAWIKEQVNRIPAQRRLLITNHVSMGYFADHYGFTILTQVIPSVSTEAGTSARQLAAVIEKVKSTGAPAIFLGKLENPDLANQIAAETGIVVVDDLYLESLSNGPPAGSYIDLMKHDVQRIVQVLQ